MDKDRTDEVVNNIDKFSSLVCLLRDCYDISPLYGHWSLPAASTERSVDEDRTDELVEHIDRFSSQVSQLRVCYDVSPLC